MVGGSWTELVVGVGSIAVALVLGLLAWNEAKQASKWAKRANQLAEATLPIAFTATVDFIIYHDGDEPGQPFDAYLELQGGEGTSSVFVHRVETAGAYVSSATTDSIAFGEMLGKWEVEPSPDEELPRRLHAGERIVFTNPWPSLSPTPVKGSWAKIKVYYSVTEDSPVRGVEVDVAIPRPPEST